MNAQEESRALAIQALNEAPPPQQLLAPLDYIFAEHFRQRSLCRILVEIADERIWDMEKAGAAARFLRGDFGLHVADEEEDLFPLLRRRAKPEDRIGAVLSQLSYEHAVSRADAATLAEALSVALAGDLSVPANRALCDRLRHFVANERSHLTTENAVVLPLARTRFSLLDLRSLARRMAARRGIDFQTLDSAG